MRREIVWPICLGLILVAVVFSQRRLKEMAADPSQMPQLPFGEEDGEPAQPLRGEGAALSETPRQPDSERTASPAPEALRQSLAEALVAFQKKAEVSELDAKDLHHSPQAMVKAAQELGRIIELEASYSDSRALFSDFYRTCAFDESSLSVIRAQCLQRYFLLSGASEGEKESVMSQLPESITRLFKAL